MEKKCAVPTFYLYGSGDDGTYDAYSRPDDDGEWCHIDDVTTELARLRAENERLRGLFSEKRRTEVEWDMVERRLSYYTIPEDDELLAALDQERKEGK